MRILLSLCLMAVVLWCFALNSVIFEYFSNPMYAEFTSVIVGVMSMFVIITVMIISILINVMRRI
jgi:hypothetical protein